MAITIQNKENQILDQIFYSFEKCIYGKYLIASWQNYCCAILFFSNKKDAVIDLSSRFPQSEITEKRKQAHQQWAKNIGQTKHFNINLISNTTELNLCVWNELIKIPYGETRSYVDIAKSISKPKAFRAVATAVSKNPWAVVIPCHRVIRNDGSLGGYAWGLEKKKEILNKEKRG